MARICAFCGRKDVTKEHVFAKWIRDEYADHRASGPSFMDYERNAETVWSYPGNALDHSINEFCARCNNGWMSQLEVKTARLVRPMLRGKTGDQLVKMGFTDQVTVASWVLKTALVLQRLHVADRRVPESFYRDFCRRQEPSSDVFVTMGSRRVVGDGKTANHFDYIERFVGSGSIGVQHIHFAIGFVYFGISMFIGRSRRYPRFMNDSAAERCIQIWPTQPRSVHWPPPPIDDLGGVAGMFAAFSGAHWL